MAAALEIAELTVRFGGLTALDRVSLTVSPGRLTGLIGPNGAGKTTLIDAVSGLTPCRGEVTFDGRDLGRRPPHRRTRLGLGRTFQGLELFEELTVRQNLLVAAEPSGVMAAVRDLLWPKVSPQVESQVDEVLELLGLTPDAERLPDDLPLGQRKIVSVARALASRPSVVLLDEPAAGLDSDESVVLGQRLRRIVDGGTSILLVDHDMGLVLSVCDYIYVLDFGKIIAAGAPQEIASDEKVIQAYLGDPSAAEVDGASAP